MPRRQADQQRVVSLRSATRRSLPVSPPSAVSTANSTLHLSHLAPRHALVLRHLLPSSLQLALPSHTATGMTLDFMFSICRKRGPC